MCTTSAPATSGAHRGFCSPHPCSSAAWGSTDPHDGVGYSAECFFHSTLLLPQRVVSVVLAQPVECSCTACYLFGESSGMNQSPILTARKHMGQWPILLKAVIPYVPWFVEMEHGMLKSQVQLEKSLYCSQNKTWDWMKLNSALQHASMGMRSIGDVLLFY